MAEDKVMCCDDSTASSSQEVLQEMVDAAPGKQEELTLQLDQIIQQKETLQEQIQVLEQCIEDCSAGMLEGLLHALSKDKQTGGTRPARGIWKDQTTYSTNDIVIAALGGSWAAARATSAHTSSPETKPFKGADWNTVWTSYSSQVIIHVDYVVTLGPTFNQKTYGTELTDWKITDTTGTTNYYVYQGGPWYNTNVEVDLDVEAVVSDWNQTNDLVTRPLNSGAFYGMQPLADALQKVEDGLKAGKDKVTNMVSVISKFIGS
jgi:hypothetical protein